MLKEAHRFSSKYVEFRFVISIIKEKS